MKCGPATYLVLADEEHPDDDIDCRVCSNHLFAATVRAMERYGNVVVSNLDPARGLFCELDDYSEQDESGAEQVHEVFPRVPVVPWERPDYRGRHESAFARYDVHNEPTSSAEIYQMFDQQDQIRFAAMTPWLTEGDQP